MPPLDSVFQHLADAIERFKAAYGTNPSYSDVSWRLEQASQELELLIASPGRREARAAARPNPTGQEPQDRREPPSAVQKTP